MVTLGSDSHKRTHTMVAVDANGRQLASRTVPATSAGHLEALRWARRWPERQWALENCRHLSRRLESDLLAAGEPVVRVSPKLVAGARRAGREAGKSDPIDALAVARAALAGAGAAGHELEPGYEIAAGALDRKVMLDRIAERLQAHQGVVAEIAGQLVEDIRERTVRVNSLERRIGGLMADLAPSLLLLEGCGGLTAAKIVGETADVSRFRSRGAYAMQNGTAPIPIWSGNRQRFRLNRGGNRRLWNDHLARSARQAAAAA